MTDTNANTTPRISRRSFLTTAAAAGGGLALGFRVPFGGSAMCRPRMAMA